MWGGRLTFALTNDRQCTLCSYGWVSDQILHIIDKVSSVLKVRCEGNVRENQRSLTAVSRQSIALHQNFSAFSCTAGNLQSFINSEDHPKQITSPAGPCRHNSQLRPKLGTLEC